MCVCVCVCVQIRHVNNQVVFFFEVLLTFLSFLMNYLFALQVSLLPDPQLYPPSFNMESEKRTKKSQLKRSERRHLSK